MGGEVFDIIGYICYAWLGLLALWGAFCVVMVWTRVGQKRFRNEKQMLGFLNELDEPLSEGDFEGAVEVCEGDRRALPQLIELALINRRLSMPQIKQLVIDKFQQDILADLQQRLVWISTTIKAAPMVGLLGTVLGMMGAFSQLATADKVEADALAGNIMVALITTACGLTIAIPLVLCMASVNNRIRKMEDLVSYGLTRFFEVFKNVHDQVETPPTKTPPPEPVEAGDRFR